MHGRARMRSTSSGTPSVISRRLRVQTRTSSPSRCTWMRAPSSLYSTVTSVPRSASAAASDDPGLASIGCRGRPTRRRTASRAAVPPVRAVAAVSGSRPDSMKARRTLAAGTSRGSGDGVQHDTLERALPQLTGEQADEELLLVGGGGVQQGGEDGVPTGHRARSGRAGELGQCVVDRGHRERRRRRRLARPLREGAPADTQAALPGFAGEPGGDRLDLVGVRAAEEVGDRRGLRGAGPGGRDGGGGGDDVGEQHAAMVTVARGQVDPCIRPDASR